MKKTLKLKSETIRTLHAADIARAIGGGSTAPMGGSDPGARTQPNCARPASLPNCTTTTL